MSINPWVTLVIVALTYAGIALGYIPKLKANRTTIALLGVGLLLLTGQVAFDQIGGFLDIDTLVLLLSMMIINANLYLAGFFRLAGKSLLKLAKTPRSLLAIEILVTGVLSALFLNDTICLMFTPLILEVTQSLKRNPLPYLIALATAANIGSTATLTGNPQNMIVGISSGISYLDFSVALTPVALLGLGGIWLVLVLIYRWEFRRGDRLEALPEVPVEIVKPMLIKSLVIVAGLLAAFLVGVPIAKAAFLAACALLITRRTHPERVFAEFDWNLLVLFSSLFIITGSLEVNGVTQMIFEQVKIGSSTGIVTFSAVTAILSNLVSNVPAVMLLRPVVGTLANPTGGWLVLAAVSTLAGNLTLLGSVANLIVAEIAGRYRVILGFWDYTRAGLVITLLSLLTGILWLSAWVW